MNVEISFESDFWDKKKVSSITNEVVNAVIYETKLKCDNMEICFLFTDDDEMQILNRTYRGIDQPTNVLSFSGSSDCTSGFCGDCNGDSIHQILGSIAVAYNTTKLESEEQNKIFEDHLKHLIVHGILHLLKYNHIEPSEAEEMEALEIEILKKMNIANPYEWKE